MKNIFKLVLLIASIILSTSCERKDLYLCDHTSPSYDIPIIDINLDVYWQYDIGIGIGLYNWKAEWYYGYDPYPAELSELNIQYHEPTAFDIYFYHKDKKDLPYDFYDVGETYTKYYTGAFKWGWYDILAFNKIVPSHGSDVYSIIINNDDPYNLYAYTNRNALGTMQQQSSNAKGARADVHYQPDELFVAFDKDEEINENLDGFVFDEERGVYVKNLNVVLQPATFIYLPELIIHNNNGRVMQPSGIGFLTGMAKSVDMKTQITGKDTINIDFNTYFKKDCNINGELCDIVAGRCLTFGMANLNPNDIYAQSKAQGSRVDFEDNAKHQVEINLVFYNGRDSTLVFDVTDQVRQKYKGGVLVMEIDMNKVPIPDKGGKGSGFDAVVTDPEEKEYEFDM